MPSAPSTQPESHKGSRERPEGAARHLPDANMLPHVYMYTQPCTTRPSHVVARATTVGCCDVLEQSVIRAVLQLHRERCAGYAWHWQILPTAADGSETTAGSIFTCGSVLTERFCPLRHLRSLPAGVSAPRVLARCRCAW